MRILAVTDVHGAYQTLEEVLRRESFDVLVIGGDLTTRGTVMEAERVLGHVSSFGKPVHVVSGNMDPPALDVLFQQRGVSINGRGVVVGDVGFFGVSGAPVSPLRTPYEIKEEEIGRVALRGWMDIAAAPVKVFVPHAPPFGTGVDVLASGAHVGSRAVRQFIETHKPHLTICGHIHESRGVDRLETSQIINCGSLFEGHYGVAEILAGNVSTSNLSL